MKVFKGFTKCINPTDEQKAWERKADKVMVLVLLCVVNFVMWSEVL